MAVLVSVEHLSTFYPLHEGVFRKTRGFVEALSDANFTVKEGQVVGVIGESGSGKSTLARTIMCLTKPTQGKVFIAGSEVTALSQKELAPLRKDFQIVFQNPAESLNKRKTIGDAFLEVLTFHKIAMHQDEQVEICAALLSKVGLEPRILSRYPHELSIGQLARVCLARAISTQPRFLILDECVSALDISLQAQVLDLLLELCSETKMSYLFISHDLAVVQHVADDVLVMLSGKIVEQGSVEAIFESPSQPYTQKLLASALPSAPSQSIS